MSFPICAEGIIRSSSSQGWEEDEIRTHLEGVQRVWLSEFWLSSAQMCGPAATQELGLRAAGA